MCDKRPDEPMVAYLLRYLVEQPRAILACIGLVAAGYMYFDLMTFVRESTSVQRDIGVQLREINTRLQHLEREHECARKEQNHDH